MEIERFVEEAQREAQQRRLVSAHPAEEALWAYVGGHLPERALEDRGASGKLPLLCGESRSLQEAARGA
jgi:hypothetical protein